MKRRHFITLTALLLAGSLQAGQPGGTFLSVTEENDLFSNPFGKHQDRHYTQGLRISLVANETYFTNAAATMNRWLPACALQVNESQFGWIVLGQTIYTPSDILDSEPLVNDRPYAGWLFTGLNLQRLGTTWRRTPVLESWEINIGVVGPESLADKAQSTVHQYQDPYYVPLGWGNQLDTELGVELKYARHWRLTPSPRLAKHLDFIPNIGASVGNIRTHATAGGIVRLGWNLPADFGPQLIDSAATDYSALPHTPHPFGFYLFTGVAGRAVGRNIFLDGNTFNDSLRADKEWFVGDWSWGFAFHAFRHLEFSYTRVRRTHEFKTQQGMDTFGSLNLRLVFDF